MIVLADHDHGHDHDHDHGHDHHDDHGHEPVPVIEAGPIAQSVAVGFRAIYIGILVLAGIWLTSNARQIAPDSQAVVFRFGRMVRTQEAGLLMALPRPFEQVRLLPGPDRQLSQTVGALPVGDGAALPSAALPSAALPSAASPGAASPNDDAGLEAAAPDPAAPANPLADAAPYLTGDGNMVLLGAALTYRIADPRAFLLAEDRFGPALDRLFRTVTVQVAAARNLNDFLVVRSGADAADDAALADLRAEVRDSLLRRINERLAALAAQGLGLGVEVERIDMTAWLPPEAKIAFDAVLTATQEAERGVAAARTAAELRMQVAARERDQVISAAAASATEQVANAHAKTASIIALQRQATPQTRDALLLQAYRSQLADLMRRVGAVTVVDPTGGARVITSGGTQ